MAKRLQSFTVFASITIECSIDVRAESLDDALNKSRFLELDDFVTVLGELVEEKTKIKGVYEA